MTSSPCEVPFHRTPYFPSTVGIGGHQTVRLFLRPRPFQIGAGLTTYNKMPHISVSYTRGSSFLFLTKDVLDPGSPG